MSVRFQIYPGRGLVHVVYDGFARLSDTVDAFQAYSRHPDFRAGQKHLVDLSRLSGFEKDYPALIAMQAHKAEAFVSGAQTLIVYYAPTQEGLALAQLAVRSWETLGVVVPVVQRTEADALAILGLRETRIAELEARVQQPAPRLRDSHPHGTVLVRCAPVWLPDHQAIGSGAMSEPSFTMGIEEEYLLIDQTTKDLVDAPAGMMQHCSDKLGDQVSREFKRCQVEIGTKVCKTIAEARDDLKRLRSTVKDAAAPFGIAPVAISCHPFADWKDQHHTDKARYNTLAHDLAGVSRRMLICGMHVHVGIEDPELRIDLLNQASYFLPHLLALSGSSPFWQGEDTGLSSYRLTVFDNLPRTGLPPRISSFGEFERSVQAIVATGAIEDATKIWWDLRPSFRFPTLEMRICDNSPMLEHTLVLAALFQSTLRMLWRLSQRNQRWRIYDTFLIGENRWRAQRYGTKEGLIDFGRRAVLPFSDLLDEWIDLVREDAEVLGCLAEVEAARDIIAIGNGADRQRAIWAAAREKSDDDAAAMRAVLSAMEAEFSMGL